MRVDRPKISVPYAQLDNVMELISISLLICIWIYPIINYSELPEDIALHFNSIGEADDFGSKMIIWILPGIATVIFLILFSLNKFPHLHNYMVNITEENALKNYRLSTRLLRFINMFCMLIFLAIIFDVIGISQGLNPRILSIWFLIATIIIPIVAAVAAISYQKKINE